jgi:hypothetical protein
MLEIIMAVYVGMALGTSLVLFLDNSYWDEFKGANSLQLFLTTIGICLLWPYAAYKTVTQ